MSDDPVLPGDIESPAAHVAESAASGPTNGADHGHHLVNPVPVGPGDLPIPSPSTSTAGGRSRPRDGDLMSSPGDAPGIPAPVDAGDAALLGLVDRLAAILERGELAELEVSAGATTIIVRSPAAVERVVAPSAFVPPVDGGNPSGTAPALAAAPPASPAAPPVRPSVKAPLTGIFYGAPSPGATAYVSVGDHVSVVAVVIGSELLTRFLDYSDRGTCILFGDGAGAVVLSASDEPAAPGGIELTTDPQGAYMIWLPAGGPKAPSSVETISRGQHKIRMEGKETYRFATRTLASTGLAAVAKAGWTQDDIDLIIPHQANIRIIEAVAKGLDLPMDRFFVNVDRYGNTSAASVPIALAEAVNSGRVKPGDKLVFVAFGAGFTSGAVALEWTADPTRGPIGEAAVSPQDIHVRQPVDWDSVDPIPPALAEILARPLPGHLDLSDVAPGEPAHATR